MKKKLPYILILLTCCGMEAGVMGINANAYGVFFTPVSEALGVGRGTIALHATITSLATGFGGPLVVKAMKKVHIKALAIPGILLVCLSMLLRALADSIWMFNVLGLLCGIGCACCYLSTATIVLGNWFSKSLGTATGIMLASTGISGAVFSPLLSYVITQYGYQIGYIVCAGIIAVLALPGVIFCLELRPEDKGLVPYGADEEITEQQKKNGSNYDIPLVLLSPAFVCLCGLAFFSYALTAVNGHLVGFAESIGSGSAVGASLMSACMIGNIISKFIIGIMIDRFGVVKSTNLLLLVSLSGVLIFLVSAGSTPVLMLAAFLFGTLYATTGVALASLTRVIYGNEQYGEAYSIASIMSLVSAAIFISVIGYVYDLTGSYTPVLIGAGVLMLICIGFIQAASMLAKSKAKSCLLKNAKGRG